MPVAMLASTSQSSPMCMWLSQMPGTSVLPRPSMVRVPAGRLIDRERRRSRRSCRRWPAPPGCRRRRPCRRRTAGHCRTAPARAPPAVRKLARDRLDLRRRSPRPGRRASPWRCLRSRPARPRSSRRRRNIAFCSSSQTGSGDGRMPRSKASCTVLGPAGPLIVRRRPDVRASPGRSAAGRCPPGPPRRARRSATSLARPTPPAGR